MTKKLEIRKRNELVSSIDNILYGGKQNKMSAICLFSVSFLLLFLLLLFLLRRIVRFRQKCGDKQTTQTHLTTAGSANNLQNIEKDVDNVLVER